MVPIAKVLQKCWECAMELTAGTKKKLQYDILKMEALFNLNLQIIYGTFKIPNKSQPSR